MSKVFYCNKCGKKIHVFDEQERISIQQKLGYGSRYDGEILDMDLCYDCLDDLIESCEISPFNTSVVDAVADAVDRL